MHNRAKDKGIFNQTAMDASAEKIVEPSEGTEEKEQDGSAGTPGAETSADTPDAESSADTISADTIKDEELDEAQKDGTGDKAAEDEISEGAASDAATEADAGSGTSDSGFRSFTDYDQAYQDVYDEILKRFRSFSPSEEIAGKITEEHITEYLEGSREERMQEFKERREKRLLSALEVLAVLTSIILIVKFLSDSPAILVNILYIIGGLLALWIWKFPHNKDR